MSILITSANSAQAHKLKNSLKDGPIILGDYMDLPAFMLVPGKMIKLPDPRSISYTHEMLTLCMDNSVDVIYPLQQQELEPLLKAEKLFKEYNIDILTISNEIQ